MDVRIEVTPAVATALVVEPVVLIDSGTFLNPAPLLGRVISFLRLLSQGKTSLSAVSPDFNLAMEVGAV